MGNIRQPKVSNESSEKGLEEEEVQGVAHCVFKSVTVIED